MERINHSPTSFIFADGVDESTRDAICDAAAARAGRSQHRRDLCLGVERLSTAGLKGKARQYAGKYMDHIREARALVVEEAAKRGCVVVDVTGADRYKYWAIRCQD